MGGFGTAFAGALEGVGDALHREHQEQFTTEVENRKSLMKMYGEMAMNPNVPKDMQQEALRRWGIITQIPYNKKLSSDLTKPIERKVQLQQPNETAKNPPPMVLGGGTGQPAAPPPGPSAISTAQPDNPGPANPVSGAGGAAPGVLQGQANELPPAVTAPLGPSASMSLPMTQQLPRYRGPTTQPGVTYSPQEIAAQDASRASQITSAQTEAQLISKYQAYIKMGMDPQRAAFMASGMASMVRPVGSNVILDDGTHKAATKIFDPSDMRFHYWVGEDDITDRVVGTATSNAQVQGWPKVTDNGASVQLAPNGQKYFANDSNMPPEAQQALNSWRSAHTRESSSSTTPVIGGGSVTTRKTGPAAPPVAPGASGAKPRTNSSGTQSSKAGFNLSSGNQQVDYWTNQVEADAKNLDMIKSDKALTGQVRANLARRGVDINQVDASTRAMSNLSRAILPKIDSVLPEIQAQAKNLGPFIGRWQNFLRGDLGAGAPPEYVRLANDIGLIQTAVMRAHTGARGSNQILEKFANMLNAGRMDAPTLTASLQSFKDTLEHYKAMVPRASEMPNAGGTGGGQATRPRAVNDKGDVIEFDGTSWVPVPK